MKYEIRKTKDEIIPSEDLESLQNLQKMAKSRQARTQDIRKSFSALHSFIPSFLHSFIILIAASVLFPVVSHGEAEHLQFTFRNHCEETNPSCDQEIPEQDEFFAIQPNMGQSVKIDLVIENPKKEMITSVRAKLKFEKGSLEVTDLNTEDSDFTLPAPNENDIDSDEGTVIIGRSFVGGSKSDKEFHVATLTIKPLKIGTFLEFVNYQDTELGDTGIFFTSSVTAENRLQEEPKPLRFGGGFGNAQPIGNIPINNDDLRNPNIGTGGSGVPLPGDAGFSGDIIRPMGLRLQTDEQGNVRLIWPIDENPTIAGYYLYYSQKSGYYLRRRDVGKTNFALFPNLPSGEKYYFAIKAYNDLDGESDYSNEVFVTVGLPGSESHGFSGDPAALPTDKEGTKDQNEKQEESKTGEDANKTVDSGPEHIFFFLIISIGITFFGYALRTKR